MQLPIINGIYSTGETDFGVAYPVNMVAVPVESGISKGYLRPADGIVPFCTLPGLDRGGINWNGAHYRVAGSKFVRVDPNGSVAVLGDVGYGGRASFDYSFERLGIAASGKLFYYDGAAFVEVTDPDLGTVVDMLWVDGYFMTTDGEFLVTTELTDPTSVSPFKYGSSEIDPDPIIAIKKINNNIYAVNRYSIEAFGNTGGEFFPFSRVEGAQAERGAVGTHAVAIANGMLVFVGSGRNESFGLYAATNGETQKLSTREIDRILNSYTEEVLSGCLVEFFLYDGHESIMIHLPDKTLSLDMKASAIVEEPAWSVLSSGTEKVSKYRGTGHVYAFNNWFVADPLLPRLGVLSKKVSTHWGQEVMWEFYTSIVYNEAKGAIFHELELVTVPGDGTGTLGVSGLASTPGIKAVPPSSDVGGSGGGTGGVLTPDQAVPETAILVSHGYNALYPVTKEVVDEATLATTPMADFAPQPPYHAKEIHFSRNNDVCIVASDFLGSDQANFPGFTAYRKIAGAYVEVPTGFASVLSPDVISAATPEALVTQDGYRSYRCAASASGGTLAVTLRVNDLSPALQAQLPGSHSEKGYTIPIYRSSQECVVLFEWDEGLLEYAPQSIQTPQYALPTPSPLEDPYPWWAPFGVPYEAVSPFFQVQCIAPLNTSDGFSVWFCNGPFGELWNESGSASGRHRGLLTSIGSHVSAFGTIYDDFAEAGPEGLNSGWAFLGVPSASSRRAQITYSIDDSLRALSRPVNLEPVRIQYRELLEGTGEMWSLGALLNFQSGKIDPVLWAEPGAVGFTPDMGKIVVEGRFDDGTAALNSQSQILIYNLTPDPRAYRVGPFGGTIEFSQFIDQDWGGFYAPATSRLYFSPTSKLMFENGHLFIRNSGTGEYSALTDGGGAPSTGGITTYLSPETMAFKNHPAPVFYPGEGGTPQDNPDPGWPTTPGYDGVPSLILNGDASYKATQGVGGTVWASYSTDGRTWSQERPAKTGRLGDNKARLRWFKNGMMRHWRIQKFRGTSSAFVSIAALEARIEPLGH